MGCDCDGDGEDDTWVSGDEVFGPNGGKGIVTEHRTDNGEQIIQRESGGYYYNDAENSKQVSVGSPNEHGNTLNDAPTEIYKKYDANNNFLKHGISQDASKRYTKKELNGGHVDVVDIQPRIQAARTERARTERNPGPENREPWAGKRDPNHSNYDPNYDSDD